MKLKTRIKLYTVTAYVVGGAIGTQYDTLLTAVGIAIMISLGFYLDEIFPETKV